MTDKTSHPVQPSKQARPTKHVENSTDATRGEPLAMRAQKRKLELERALEKRPAGDVRARNDINAAVASINALLTGDVDHLSDTTAAELSRLLESSKHLAEFNPVSRKEHASKKAAAVKD
jgi:cell division septum initiation protein DivIVA